MRKAQSRFAYLVGVHLAWLYAKGYEVTFGDAYRDPRAFGYFGEDNGPYGAPNSQHKHRLAIDLNLFKDGKFLENSSDHAEAGAHWESLDDKCRWGGRYNDGNHYEYMHNGWR